MAKPTSIPDIYEHPADAVLYSVQGTVKQVFPRKTGTIKKGPNTGNPWSLQNLTLTDGQTEIGVVLKDREDEIPKHWMHSEILLEAHQGQKGWSGVYAFDDDYNNTVTRKIKVTATGIVSRVGGESAPAAPPPHHQPAPPPQAPANHQEPPKKTPPPRTGEAQQPPTDPAANQKLAEKKFLRDAVVKATQIANLQLLCLNTVENYTAPRFREKCQRDLTTAERHAFAMNMCIELMRGGVHWTMPGHEMASPKPPPQPQLSGGEPPATWKGKPWPEGAVPHPETGEPIDPDTGNVIW